MKRISLRYLWNHWYWLFFPRPQYEASAHMLVDCSPMWFGRPNSDLVWRKRACKRQWKLLSLPLAFSLSSHGAIVFDEFFASQSPLPIPLSSRRAFENISRTESFVCNRWIFWIFCGWKSRWIGACQHSRCSTFWPLTDIYLIPTHLLEKRAELSPTASINWSLFLFRLWHVHAWNPHFLCQSRQSCLCCCHCYHCCIPLSASHISEKDLLLVSPQHDFLYCSCCLRATKGPLPNETFFYSFQWPSFHNSRPCCTCLQYT